MYNTNLHLPDVFSLLSCRHLYVIYFVNFCNFHVFLGVTYPGNKQLKDEALRFVLELEAEGGTNIHDSMVEGLNLIETVHKNNVLPSNARQVQHFEEAHPLDYQ